MGIRRVITIAHNEADILPYFVKHYKSIADEFIIYDNDSSDETALLAQELGCVVIPFQTEGCDRIEQTNLQNKNCEINKECEWLIIVDVDEFLDIDDLKVLFSSSSSIAKCEGYQMFDEQLSVSNRVGIRSTTYDKFSVFRPSNLDTIKIIRGRHVCFHNGLKQYEGIVRLYHYKYIGGIDRVVAKHASYMARIKDKMSRNNEYMEANTRAMYNYLKQNAKQL